MLSRKPTINGGGAASSKAVYVNETSVSLTLKRTNSSDDTPAPKKYKQDETPAPKKYKPHISLLIAALKAKDEDKANALLDEGVDPNEVHRYGRNALHYAAEYACSLRLFKRIVGLIKNVNAVDTFTKATALITIMSSSDRLDLVKALMDHPDINLNAQTDYNSTALHLAAYHDRPIILKELLCDDKIDASLVDQGNKTPLEIAIHWKHTECAKILKAYDESRKPNPGTVEMECGFPMPVEHVIFAEQFVKEPKRENAKQLLELMAAMQISKRDRHRSGKLFKKLCLLIPEHVDEKPFTDYYQAHGDIFVSFAAAKETFEKALTTVKKRKKDVMTWDEAGNPVRITSGDMKRQIEAVLGEGAMNGKRLKRVNQ